MQWSAVVQELSNRTPQSLQDRQSLTIYNDCDEHADVADRSTRYSFERQSAVFFNGEALFFFKAGLGERKVFPSPEASV